MRTKMTSMEEHFCFHRWLSGTFLLFPYHLPKEVIVKGAKSQVWKQWLLGFSWMITPQVFLKSYGVKDNKQPQGQSNLGKLPLTERLESSAIWATFQTNRPSVLLALYVFSIDVSYTMLFVFIVECQLVLMKPPVLSKPWVIWVVVRVMTTCFLLLRIYSQLVVFRWWGSGDVVVVLVLGKSFRLNTHICCLFFITIVH